MQTVFPWQMVGYLDTGLALLEQVVRPKPDGVMMCGGGAGGPSNFERFPERFPWTGPVKGPAGPCTGVYTLGEVRARVTARGRRRDVIGLVGGTHARTQELLCCFA